MLAKSHLESIVTAEQRAARVQLMVLDVDGVLTDGRLYYGPQGEAMKVFDVRDGHGIKMLLNEWRRCRVALSAQLRHRFCAGSRTGDLARVARPLRQGSCVCDAALRRRRPR